MPFAIGELGGDLFYYQLYLEFPRKWKHIQKRKLISKTLLCHQGANFCLVISNKLQEKPFSSTHATTMF